MGDRSLYIRLLYLVCKGCDFQATLTALFRQSFLAHAACSPCFTFFLSFIRLYRSFCKVPPAPSLGRRFQHRHACMFLLFFLCFSLSFSTVGIVFLLLRRSSFAFFLNLTSLSRTLSRYVPPPPAPLSCLRYCL